MRWPASLRKGTRAPRTLRERSASALILGRPIRSSGTVPRQKSDGYGSGRLPRHRRRSFRPANVKSLLRPKRSTLTHISIWGFGHLIYIMIAIGQVLQYLVGVRQSAHREGYCGAPAGGLIIRTLATNRCY